MIESVDYDQAFMALAMSEAYDARSRGERPFGCVITDARGRILGKGSGTGSDLDPTCHSEISAIREACAEREGLLEGCTLFSTHEPCTMCCGAIMHAKISRVVWGSWRADLPELFRAQLYDASVLLKNTSTPPEVRADVLNKDCVALFARELAKL